MGVLPFWPNRGPVGLRAIATKWLPNSPICQPHTILRFIIFQPGTMGVGKSGKYLLD